MKTAFPLLGETGKGNIISHAKLNPTLPPMVEENYITGRIYKTHY